MLKRQLLKKDNPIMTAPQTISPLVPALRFPQFANADAWQSVRLGEVCEMQAGKFIQASDIKTAGQYPVYGGNGLRGYAEVSNCSGKYPIVGRQGEQCGNVKLVSGDFYATEHAVVTTPKDDVNVDFLYYLLDKLNLHQYAVGQAQPGLSVNTILKANCVLPTLPEQQKIASCLSSLDEYISLTKKKLDLLKLHKKGLLQNLFPKNGETKPKFRFPGFEGEWKVVKLGEVGDTFTGLSGKNKDDFGHGNAEYITYLNVFQNPIARQETNQPIEIDYKQNSVIYGDVFFTTSSETPNEVGMSSVWLYNKTNVYLNSFCFGYRINIDIDYIYLSYYLRSDYFRKLIVVLAQGISRYNISKVKVMNLPLLLPSLAEQGQIASCLSSIDNKIAKYGEKLKALEVHKKGLMQKLFPKIN